MKGSHVASKPGKAGVKAMTIGVIASLSVILLAVVAVLRGIDVRLALVLAAVVLGLIGGNLPAVVRTFLATLAREQFVVPICTAMGFAHVLRRTGCDQHLVHMLVKPLEYVRFLILPGAVVIGFLVNIPIISQTSTAVAIGAVLIPLLLAARISPVTTGATLLIGASMGGELLNPGAPELRTVANELNITSNDCVSHVLPLLIVQAIVATLVFWILSVRAERKVIRKEVEIPVDKFTVNPLKAMIPLVPLVLLFLTGGPFYLLKIPHEWLLDPTKAGEISLYDGRLIGAAMLIGVVTAILVTPSAFYDCGKSFFEGAGYAYTHIISLIVAANTFGAGVEHSGLAQMLGQITTASPSLLVPSAIGLPLTFGWLGGSGMAATQSLYKFFVKPAQTIGVSAVDLGALVGIAAAAGRTLSPVAAVTLMCASMTNTKPIELCKRVAIPLLAGLVCLLVLGLILFRPA
ncbi:C4-dicarboxylate transporter DcuC [soil metagenome]